MTIQQLVTSLVVQECARCHKHIAPMERHFNTGHYRWHQDCEKVAARQPEPAKQPSQGKAEKHG